jgi:hypothetical protein
MTINIKKLEADMRWEAKRFVMQALATGAALLAAGAGIATLAFHLAGKI